MEQHTDRCNPADLTTEKKENVILGAIGALLFSLAGAIVFFLLNLVGYIASISGLVAVAAGFFGYGLFSGNKKSVKGVVIATVAAILIMVFANYACFAYEFYQLQNADGLALSFGDVLSKVPALIAGERVTILHGVYEYYYEIDRSTFYSELVVSLIFCALGAFGFVYSTIKKIKTEKDAEVTQREDKE